MPVKRWWRLATLHKDVREGRLDEGVFSADSAKVSHPEVNKKILEENNGRLRKQSMEEHSVTDISWFGHHTLAHDRVASPLQCSSA